MVNVAILSLVILSSSVIHLCCCSPPSQENDEKIEAELERQLHRLTKANDDQYSRRQGSRIAERFPSMSGRGVSACGSGRPLQLTASAGTIKSPGYADGTYPNNADCQWLITAPPGNVISATFQELSLEAEASCSWDSVKLYDVSRVNSDQWRLRLLGTFCTAATSTITSSGTGLLVAFKSDSSVNEGRFSLSWTFVSQGGQGSEVSACGNGKPVQLTDSTGTIKSPGYADRTYPNNADCQWLITAPSGKAIVATFDELSLEPVAGCTYDKVILYDGSSATSQKLGTFCSMQTSSITSSGSSLFIVFQTDRSVNEGRFSLSWSFVSASELPPSGLTCGTPAVEPSITPMRIVGGVEARKHSWPWQCFIHVQFNRTHYKACGGSVISDTYILTAAHCFFHKDEKSGIHNRIQDDVITVLCGLHDLKVHSDNIQRIRRISSVLHENYSPSGNDWDVAVLRLSSSLKYNDFVQPICLPSTPVSAGTNCVVTGWGVTKGTGDNNVLRQVVLPIISLDDCRKISYSFRAKLTDNMMCAGYMDGGKDSCQGDSGGPLVCKRGDRWEQHGVVSWGFGCAAPRHPGVYADVVKFLPWIEKKTGIGASARMA